MEKALIQSVKTTVFEATEQALPLLGQFGISREAFNRIALNALVDNPAIAKCESRSIRKVLLRCAEIGIMPDGQSAAIIPTKIKGVLRARLDIMVGGMLDKVRKELPGFSFSARSVYKEDEFEFVDGLEPVLRHKPSPDQVHTREDFVAAYAIAWIPENPHSEFEVLYKVEIERYRAYSPQKNGILWTQHYGEAAEKTVAKLLLKRLPIRSSVKALLESADKEELDWENQIEEIDETTSSAKKPEAAKETPVQETPQQQQEEEQREAFNDEF